MVSLEVDVEAEAEVEAIPDVLINTVHSTNHILENSTISISRVSWVRIIVIFFQLVTTVAIHLEEIGVEVVIAVGVVVALALVAVVVAAVALEVEAVVVTIEDPEVIQEKDQKAKKEETEVNRKVQEQEGRGQIIGKFQ